MDRRAGNAIGAPVALSDLDSIQGRNGIIRPAPRCISIVSRSDELNRSGRGRSRSGPRSLARFPQRARGGRPVSRSSRARGRGVCSLLADNRFPTPASYPSTQAPANAEEGINQRMDDGDVHPSMPQYCYWLRAVRLLYTTAHGTSRRCLRERICADDASSLRRRQTGGRASRIDQSLWLLLGATATHGG